MTKDVEVEEEVENLPEVDLEELASAKKSLLMIQKRKSWTMNLTSKVKKTLIQMKEKRARPMFSDDEDEDLEDLNAENMELYSKRLDEEERLEAEEAEKELLEAETKQPRAKVLPTAEEEEEMAKGPQDVTMVRTRMLEVVKVLENFKELAEEEHQEQITLTDC